MPLLDYGNVGPPLRPLMAPQKGKRSGLMVTLGLLNIVALQYFLLSWLVGYSHLSQDMTSTVNITEDILESFKQRRLHITNICQENEVLDDTK